MSTRDLFLLECRGEAIGKIFDYSMNEEIFQNQTLRPILKFQNDLFVAAFKNYLSKHKTDFYNFSPEKKMIFIETAIQKDIKFRNALKGMIVGIFTIKEYDTYIQNASNLNKRMMTMLIERLKSQVQIL